MTNRVPSFISRRPLTATVATVAVLFAATLSGLTLHYDTNDDVQMACIAAGLGLAATPDEHLLFSNVVIGRVLNSLYAWRPEVAWYGWYLIAAQFAGNVALLFSMLTVSPRSRTIGLFALYFCGVGTYYLTTLQFTTTACLLAQGGWLMMLSGLWEDREAPPRLVSARWPLSVLLLVISAAVRWGSFQMMALVAMPAIVATFWAKSHRNRRFVAAGVCGLTALLAGICVRYDQQTYDSQTEWREAREFITQIMPFVGYNAVTYDDSTRPVFDRLGWSQNDFDILLNWFYLDEGVFRSETLATLLADAGTRRTIGPAQVVAATMVFFQRILSNAPLTMSFLWSVCLIWNSRQPRWNRWMIIGTGATAFVILSGLQLFLWRTPDRVMFPLVTFPLAFALCLPQCTDETKKSRWSPLMSIAGLFFSALILSQHFETGCRAREIQSAMREDFSQLKARGNKPLLVCSGRAFPFESILPLDSAQFLSAADQIHLGPTLRTPIVSNVLQKRHVSNLFHSLVTDDQVWLVAPRDNVKMLQTYLQEHDGISTSWSRVYSGKSFTAYRGIITESKSAQDDLQHAW